VNIAADRRSHFAFLSGIGRLRMPRLRTALLTLVLFAVPATAVPATASAAPGTGWAVSSQAYPTNLAPGGTGELQVDIENVGARPSSGPLTVTDVLPPGLVAIKAGGMQAFADSILGEAEEEAIPNFHGEARWSCSGTTVVTCTSNPALLPTIPVGFDRFDSIQLQQAERIGIEVSVANAPGTGSNRVTVAGGGAISPTTVENSVTISGSEPPFGFSNFDAVFTDEDGTPATQAGSHPYSATFLLGFNVEVGGPAGGRIRNLEVAVPPGLFGDPGATPRCSRAQLDGQICPPQTQIGIEQAGLGGPGGSGPLSLEVLSVYNMVPPPGVPFEFAFSVAGFHAFFDAGVRNGSGYGLVERAGNLPQGVTILQNLLTLWGEPTDPAHDAQRFTHLPGCESGCSVGGARRPFLTLPTSCAAPQAFTVRGLGTWTDENLRAERSVLTHDDNGAPSGFTGCERLRFAPTFSATPDTTGADAPAGLLSELAVPQESLTVPGGLVPATLKNITVALPKGMVVNPGRANGLAACQPDQATLESEAPATCPAASKVGEVEVQTPLLEGLIEPVLQGDVYVMQSNPPNLQILVAASGDGVNLKLLGNVHLDETTGAPTATFSEQPPLPFTHLKLNFDGGPQAALATPPTCGTYTTQTSIDAWSGGPATTGTSPFTVSQGCEAAAKFEPTLLAGTVNTRAGAASGFTLRISKPSGQQNISTVNVALPPGQLAKLAGVPLCPDAAAAGGNCPAGSQIGSTIVGAGPGSSPLYIPQPGKAPTAVYLAGPYKAAPYSLVFKVPAEAGPFNLGTVTVRTGLYVNPERAQVTAKSDPLPQILAGVPVEYRDIFVDIDRPGFIRNPTNCEPMKVTGTIASAKGAVANVSSRYQVGECASLAFKPSLKLSLSGATKRSGVPALKAVITYPKGNYANIKSASVVLPKSEFIDNAHIGNTCTRVQFNAGAGGGVECPRRSILGHATASTPLLEKPLEGTVYLRSNGGERELPDIVAALHGQIAINLVGFIDSVRKNKNSEVSRLRTRFATAPDAPVSRFVLKLAGAKHGLLENSANLCKVKNIAQVKLVGQNGKTYDTEPAVANDCGKAAKKGKAGKSGKGH
jgi:uncharacterized repeat protein (TIGR01451 family)